jgi:hypothetical protein
LIAQAGPNTQPGGAQGACFNSSSYNFLSFFFFLPELNPAIAETAIDRRAICHQFSFLKCSIIPYPSKKPGQLWNVAGRVSHHKPSCFMNRLLAATLALCFLNQSCTEAPATPAKKKTPSTTEMMLKYAGQAKQFITQNGYEKNFCFLADMQQSSGNNRFFVYNLAADSLEFAGKVAHGRCNEEWLEGKKYSNASGSGCSSLGKYKVGNPYIGRFGLAYKLYGLDTTNNNAFNRNIVLHAHSCVPDADDVPSAICQSDGCVMVSQSFLQKLKEKISQTKKPVLLWLYDDSLTSITKSANKEKNLICDHLISTFYSPSL